MNIIRSLDNHHDNGGRRSGIDRRYFSYSNHIPERRQEVERRAKPDRRSGKDRRSEFDSCSVSIDRRDNETDRRAAWNAAGLN